MNSVIFPSIKISPLETKQSGKTIVQYNGPILATQPKEKFAIALADLASLQAECSLVRKQTYLLGVRLAPLAFR